MAVKQGLRFGSEVVFSYGPLGFLHGQYLWYGDLGVVAFLYSAALYLAVCVALVWALRRTLPAPVAALIAFVIAILPLLEQSLVVAVIICLGALRCERDQRTTNLLVLGGATFSAVEALVKLSTGPLVGVLFLLALIGLRARWWQVLAFIGLLLAEVLLLWVAAGQSLSRLPDFVRNTWEIVSGYNAAMQRLSDVAAWKVTAATVLAVLLTIALLVACFRGDFRTNRARRMGTALLALAALAVYKEGIVRVDAGHLSLYFSTMSALWVAVPWSRRRRVLLVAGALGIVVAGVPVRPPGTPTNLNVVKNVRFAADQVHSLLSPSRRGELMAEGRQYMQSIYRLPPSMLALLRGHSTAIDPWEIGAAWAYRLDWQPLPVFQNYSAYTPRLDHLNADAAAGASAPERILRENPPLVYPEFSTPGADNRYPGWDPPAQQRSILCHYSPLVTTFQWQVLGRSRDRCSRQHRAGSVTADAGQAVQVPAPKGNGLVFARIEGADLSALERLRALVLRAPLRYATLDRGRTYRLIPSTATDGLVLRASDAIAAANPFDQIPQAKTIEVTGASSPLQFEFFRVRIRPDRGQRSHRGSGP